jgi:aspartyl/glutamyl-tRNA(Asn/Gln) amidotransferase C subunit
MANISHHEILKLARISHIALADHEIAPLVAQIDTVLTYAQRVQELSGQSVSLEATDKARNVFRHDCACQSNADAILARAPHEQEGYFVVPRILENH